MSVSMMTLILGVEVLGAARAREAGKAKVCACSGGEASELSTKATTKGVLIVLQLVLRGTKFFMGSGAIQALASFARTLPL
jgi:hypothetical protein